MNLFFRLMFISLFARFRSKTDLLGECATPFRVWPTDLDVLRHMNKGVYLSLQDLARVDYMIRAGAAEKIAIEGWYPVVASETIRFRRSLQAFQKFELRTKILAWDDKYIYLEHRFTSKNEVIAIGMIKARFLKRTGGSVSSQELLSVLGLSLDTPVMADYLRAWIEADLGQSKSAGL